MRLIKLAILLFTSTQLFAASAAQPMAINVTNKRPLSVPTVTTLQSYAHQANYYMTVNLHDGMKVSFSASYGIGGEAAQATGTVVQKNGKFWFRQDSNPTANLLLPPGLSSDSSDGMSLWDIGAYMDLINRVTFSQPNTSWASTGDVYQGNLQAYLVDFNGGTAGATVSYTDAMEVDLATSVSGGNSTFHGYYAKGIGPVAMEFEETSMPSGTFQFYLGQ